MLMRCRLVILGGLLTLLLPACGFHLRGQANLPAAVSVVYVKTDRPTANRPSNLPAVLRRSLENSGATVTDEPDQAKAIVEIHNENTTQRTLAASDSDEVRSNTLVYTVEYSVTLADGSQLIPREAVGASQDFLYQEADILGRAEGERLIFKDMLATVSNSIILRMQAAAR
jgi:LPS-assembly lipoprotein